MPYLITIESTGDDADTVRDIVSRMQDAGWDVSYTGDGGAVNWRADYDEWWIQDMWAAYDAMYDKHNAR